MKLLYGSARYRLILRADGHLTTAVYQGENGPWIHVDHETLGMADAPIVIRFIAALDAAEVPSEGRKVA